MVAAILEGGRVTIDVAKWLQSLIKYPRMEIFKLERATLTELLDAYEERDRLRAALLTIERGADHPLGIVGAPAFYEAMEWASTIANAALEGRE